ncbi:MAG TPA: hypothetical protein VJX70_00590 [Candidatus Acidoferrum sp.]|nr:hypothetical protein [Candidatus Acidoferrum sp.]
MKRILAVIAGVLCLAVVSAGKQGTTSNPSTQHASRHHQNHHHSKKHGGSGKHHHTGHQPAT